MGSREDASARTRRLGESASPCHTGTVVSVRNLAQVLGLLEKVGSTGKPGRCTSVNLSVE